MDLKIAEEVARQATMEILKLREIIADLAAENDRLRKEICRREK
jgi:hypothetical protein